MHDVTYKVRRARRCGPAISVAAAAIAIACASPRVHAQLRMASYNIEADVSGTAPNPGTDTILESIGTQTVNGFARRLDIITLQETTSNTATVQPLVNSLNSFYGSTIYDFSPLQATEIGGSPGSGNGPNALIYNKQTLQLVDSVAFGTLSTSAMARQEVRYHFRPIGYSSTADFYVYCGHYKAQSGSTNEARRQEEASEVRANAATLPAGSRIIYTGDFNLTGGSTEAAWSTLTGVGASAFGQGIDPINLGNGTWSNGTTTFLSSYSESTASLNARFDFQLQTPATMSGHGVSYINGSYHVFGNAGVSLNGGNGSSTLVSSSDHYPVVADYRIPAKMSVAVASVPSQVIVGAAVPVNVTVTNSAPAQVAIGADGLDYSVAGSGNVSGSANVTGLLALNAGNTHALALSTATPGVSSGTVSATSTSAGVASGNFNQGVSTTVLAHAKPSFSAGANTASLTIDFGIRARNLAAPQSPFSINNRADASGFTADLDLDSIVGAGSTAALTTNAATFSGLAAGTNNPFSASISTASIGSLSASYTFNLSDENLPGATSTAPLVLNLIGRVALGGDANLDNKVDLTDFTILAGNFNSGGANWQTGDFNRDGGVDLTDFTILASDFNQSASAPQIGSTIPEPTAVSLISLMAGMLLRRRSAQKIVTAARRA